jgi:hypothetical protein
LGKQPDLKRQRLRSPGGANQDLTLFSTSLRNQHFQNGRI